MPKVTVELNEKDIKQAIVAYVESENLAGDSSCGWEDVEIDSDAADGIFATVTARSDNG
jgi:hypothetical protein